MSTVRKLFHQSSYQFRQRTSLKVPCLLVFCGMKPPDGA